MNEELDSQLSAMFDNELPESQCELLARRLSKDEQLKARWGRYAVIGATIRAEGGPRLSADLAQRVSVAISSEPAASEPAQVPPRRLGAWWRPVTGVAVAASVAAGAILFLRSESMLREGPTAAQGALVASSASGADHVLVASAGSADSYVVPKTSPRRAIVPTTQLANYVVAHSEFSSPVNRRNLLSAFMTNEAGAGAASAGGAEEVSEEVDDDAKSAQ